MWNLATQPGRTGFWNLETSGPKCRSFQQTLTQILEQFQLSQRIWAQQQQQLQNPNTNQYGLYVTGSSANIPLLNGFSVTQIYPPFQGQTVQGNVGLSLAAYSNLQTTAAYSQNIQSMLAGNIRAY